MEDLAHGSGPVGSSVRCDDTGQHLPRGFRLQERQVCPQTQVRTFGKDPHAAVRVSCGLVDSIQSDLFCFNSSRVAQKREDAVSKEVTRKLSEADNRKMSRKEKDERCVCVADV